MLPIYLPIEYLGSLASPPCRVVSQPFRSSGGRRAILGIFVDGESTLIIGIAAAAGVRDTTPSLSPSRTERRLSLGRVPSLAGTVPSGIAGAEAELIWQSLTPITT